MVMLATFTSVSMKLLLTGGAGFIGSAMVRWLMERTNWRVLNIDCLTYAGNLASVSGAAESSSYSFLRADIRDMSAMQRAFAAFEPDAVMHLAAESHVDRSIDSPMDFLATNVIGTYTLLQASLQYYERLSGERRENFRFHHVSTDEVFGALGDEGKFSEDSPYQPNSPYSASKAASDHFARAWLHTFGLPVVISNCSNNYGPCQFPEKLIPLMTINALEGKPLPVYGAGANVRDWLYVDDHVTGLIAVLTKGRVGESYNIGSGAEWKNLDLVEQICAIMDDLAPAASSRPHRNLIKFVADRPGHDKRYAIDATKIMRELGWSPAVSFRDGLRRTVEWYLHNAEWWQPIRDGAYQGDRLGLREPARKAS